MIKIKKNQLAMFHTHDLIDEEIDYIIIKVKAVKFLNERESYFNLCYNKFDMKEFPFVRKEYEILKSLKSKLDIFDKSEV